MKLTKTTALRLMALSGLLPLLYIISCITTREYPQVEPTFPLLIISGIIVLLTAVILVCGVMSGFSLMLENIKVIIRIISPSFRNFPVNRKTKQIPNPNIQICPPTDMRIGKIIPFLSIETSIY